MYWRLLRTNRDFRLLYAGTLISLGGDWFLTVALLDLVLSLTGSATLASLMLLCQSLPIFIVTPFAGHVVDRVDRRKLMIMVDVIRTGACLLPLLARTPALLPFAYAGVIVIAIGSSYFEPASQAALPNLVSGEELGPANVLMGSTWGTMLAVGAAVGGLVTMRFGRDVAFVVDAVSFLVSAAILAMIRTPFSEARESLAVGSWQLADAAARSTANGQQPTSVVASVRETLRYARAHPRVLALLTSKGGYGIGAGVIAMLSVFGKEVFRAGAFGIGLLFAARGLGALFGPFLIRAAGGRDELQYRLIALSVLVFGAGYIGLGLSHSLLVGATAIFVAHLGGGAQWQTSTYGLQREVPDWIRGRVFAADYGFVTLTMAVSSLAAGVLSDHFGATTATVAIASLSVGWALFWGAWTWKLWR
jgi:MFS family permease